MKDNKWECISKDEFHKTFRMKTPDGWLVKDIFFKFNSGYQEITSLTSSICYVPDEGHKWTLENRTNSV